MVRHKMSLRCKMRAGQSTPEDAKHVAQEINDDIAAHGITAIYNTDQTAVNYEYQAAAAYRHSAFARYDNQPERHPNDLGQKQRQREIARYGYVSD